MRRKIQATLPFAPPPEPPKRSFEVVSCSRRGDVPAFRLPWFLARAREGFVDVANPHHHARVSGKPPVRVSLDPRTVRCIAWWSKDYAEWIATWQAESDASPGTLHAFDAHIFNFTLNGAACASVLEPGVRHSFSERLDQLAWLCSAFSPDAVVLRFDPIVHFRRLSEAEVLNNLGDFEAVCSAAGQIGLREVTTAFVCAYPAVQARMQARGLSIVEQSAAEKAAVLERMTATAQSHGLTLRGCCQPPELQLPHGACVSAERVNRLLRAKRMPLLSSAATARDKGQRYPLCHCTQSRDIGGYGADFACPHSCAYCYANPAPAPQQCAHPLIPSVMNDLEGNDHC